MASCSAAASGPPASGAPETPLSSILRVATRPFGAEEFEFAREYAGPPVGENADFMAFVNLRWTEAQARGHREMVVSALAVPAAEAMFPGLLHQINSLLSGGNFDAANALLDSVDGMADRIAEAISQTAEVVFSCRQGDGVHETFAAWREGREITYTMLPGAATLSESPPTGSEAREPAKTPDASD